MYSPEPVKWVWGVEHVEVKFVISKFDFKNETDA
jgi:hypothetical protein